MKREDGGLELVDGFDFSAVKCGIRYENRLDYAVIFSRVPCTASGTFTINKITAAPVRLCRERIANSVHAILINSTNANACTGDEGYHNAEALTGDFAVRLSVAPESVLMASTGIIGRQLPLDKMLMSNGELASGLSRENGKLIPRAIMTTDTVEKYACYSFPASSGTYRVAGTAKGAGMIAPNMATLLAFIITDARIPKDILDIIFRKAIGRTLNAITIDGDMSTNDTAIILSPSTGKPLETPRDLDRFEDALGALLNELAGKLVADGEGVTKKVTVDVLRARSDADARKIAKAVSESLLVKTALFGNDPNWGRIACAAGYSGADLEEPSLTIKYDDLTLLDNGRPVPFENDAISKILSKDSFTITIDVGLGRASFRMLTTDLSLDYVKINAEYST